MKILVIGSGGREHALVWRLAKRPGHELYAMPGNPGIARIAECIPARELSSAAILATARALGVDLTIIGPEAPLVGGVVDLFRAEGLRIVGPNAAAAQLEGSKMFAKRFFADHHIPTARFEAVTTQLDAADALKRFTFPVVIKADGLAAGKGVIIASNQTEAERAILQLGPALVLEEFLTGPEVSLIVLSDGRDVVPLRPARDHKRVSDGDQGPNTGGMGAFCDQSLLSESQTEDVLDRIIKPTVDATAFSGFLYAGLMMTPDGPKLLEYNVRLGDPEAQVLLHHLDDDLAELCMAMSEGTLGSRILHWKDGVSHCVVLAAGGYPGPFRSADPITGIADAENRGAAVFHAGTRVGWSGYVTGGGRVLTVTSSGTTLAEAADNTYAAVRKINFDGMHYRRDIGRAKEEPNRIS